MKQKEHRAGDRLSLPIDPYLDQIVKDGQNHSTLLIKASPGSGKTTRLPWAMTLNSPKKVLVLEPRRLAAKLAAQRIAFEQQLQLGAEVGYHFRFEKKITAQTQLIFYTEGTFLKTLVQDPELSDVGLVILDEFHERHIETDIALAALRSLQERRKDFKLMLMSATLDTRIFDYFTDSKTIEIEAPRFRIDIDYLANVPSILNQKLEVKIKNALQTFPQDGDVLVFVPGMREMLQTQDYLGSSFGIVLLLHSDLSKEEQDLALEQQAGRRVILATNIAESSVTIPGIKYVIDSGIQREANYSPWSGLKTLADRPITQSSAIQRAGRAGRTSAGVCFRLYAEQDFQNREPHTIPEIMRADLTDTALLVSELKSEMKWFSPPPAERWKRAQELAIKMGATDSQQGLTPVGRSMLSYPLDARLSRSLVAGEKLLPDQKKLLLGFITEEIEKDRSGVLWSRLQYFLKGSGSEPYWEKALLSGFIDQVAKYRHKQHDFIHYSGKTIKCHPGLKDLQDGYYIIFDVTQRQEAILVLAIEEDWLYDVEPFPFESEEAIEVRDTIIIKSNTKLGSLMIDETLLTAGWQQLKQSVREKLLILTQTPFKKKLQEWTVRDSYSRLQYWAKIKGIDLLALEEKLSIKGYFEHFDALNFEKLDDYFQDQVQTDLNLSGIDEELPNKIHLGGKRELKVFYPSGMDPYVEAPIQDFYGQKSTPTILRGKVPLTMKLMGPHRMPIQVTKDLPGFWERTYPQMKREYQRDYPRHYWPDDPASAQPFLLKSFKK